MIKAVFFDLYHTLVRFEPPREKLESQALKDFGVDVSPEVLHRPLATADEFIYQEIARRSLSQRSREEKMALYTRYQEIVLREAGIEAGGELVRSVLGKMQQSKMKMVLFDDVAPVLTDFKSRGLILGLISNVEEDMSATFSELGLTAWLDTVVTSRDSAFSKPQPEIYQEALKKVGVQPAEAVYVGDQYQVDIVGANRAGMKGILLDRGGYSGDITDCPRIQGLSELAGYL